MGCRGSCAALPPPSGGRGRRHPLSPQRVRRTGPGNRVKGVAPLKSVFAFLVHLVREGLPGRMRRLGLTGGNSSPPPDWVAPLAMSEPLGSDEVGRMLHDATLRRGRQPPESCQLRLVGPENPQVLLGRPPRSDPRPAYPVGEVLQNLRKKFLYIIILRLVSSFTTLLRAPARVLPPF